MSRRVVPDLDQPASERAVRSLTDAIDGIIKSPMASGVLVSDLVAGQDVELIVPHGLGRKPVGCILLSSDRGLFDVTLAGGDSRSAVVRATPRFEHVERYEVDQDLSADFNFSYVPDGESDWEYMVSGLWLTSNTGIADLCRWRINDLATTLTSEGSTYRDTSTGTSSDTSGLVVGVKSQTSLASELLVESRMLSKSGSIRLCTSAYVETFGTTTSTQENGSSGGKWEDTSEKISKVGLAFTSNNCLAGSYFNLYRRPRLKGRRLNLWVF